MSPGKADEKTPRVKYRELPISDVEIIETILDFAIREENFVYIGTVVRKGWLRSKGQAFISFAIQIPIGGINAAL